MKILFVLIFVLSITSIVNSELYTIKIDGTGDFATIQDGINASSNGDTVLVYPGTYYENIKYNGKNIKVASLYLTTQIDSFINATIIDGNHIKSTVRVVNGENSTASLIGLTVQNGSGTLDQWEIISGGGIFINNSSLKIYNCIIQDNIATRGGGLRIDIRNTNNVVIFKKTTLRYNHAYEHGGGISVTSDSPVTFNQQERCNIYLNTSGSGCDFALHRLEEDPKQVFVDTFTVMEPDKFFFSDYVESTIDIQHGKITPVNQDLYVATDGNNNNSGTNENEPLKNIYYALIKIASDNLHPNTIHIAEGTYSPSLTGEKYPLNIRSNITIEGEGGGITILDAEETYCIFYDWDYQRNYSIKNMTITNGKKSYGAAITYFQPRNALIENVRFEDNLCPDGGRSVIASPWLSAFIIDSTKVTLKKIEAINNTGGKSISTGPVEQTKIINSLIKENKPNYQADFLFGGGLLIHGISGYDDRWSTQIINSEITENIDAETTWPYPSSAMTIYNNQNVSFINCTIGNNIAPSTGECIEIAKGCTVSFYNSIIYGDYPREMYVNGQSSPNTVIFSHTLLEGGQWDIAVQGTNTLNWLDGNLDTNPMWEGIGEYPYYLSTGSPCIDAGTFNLPDSIEIPIYDLAGNPRIYGDMIDMGAYEWQGYGIDDEPELPENIINFMNSPNPFTDHTNIICSIKDIQSNKDISLKIYNSRGQLIKSFGKDNFELSPYIEIYWDGIDEHGNQVSSGTYFYKLEYNGDVMVRKMVKVH